eukprot:6698924-Prymnesium_polylepis.1
MPPKATAVVEKGHLGRGVTFEVRPASKGSPTVHVVVNGRRLPAFRRKAGSTAEEQVRQLPNVRIMLSEGDTAGVPTDAAPGGASNSAGSRTLAGISTSNETAERLRTAARRQPKARPEWWPEDYQPAALRCRATGIRRSLLSEIEEAARAEPELAIELEDLFTVIGGTVADGAALDDSLEAEMERTAALLAHAALVEQLASTETNEEHAYIWAEAAPSAILSTPARMEVDHSEAWGMLTIEPPLLKFSTAVEEASEQLCSVGDMEWPLASFAGAHDDAVERARCELRLLQGEDDGLVFGFRKATDL